jgi:hypothetical protein
LEIRLAKFEKAVSQPEKGARREGRRQISSNKQKPRVRKVGLLEIFRDVVNVFVLELDRRSDRWIQNGNICDFDLDRAFGKKEKTERQK